MRPQVSWMTENDNILLEFLSERDLALSPRVIKYNLETRENVDMAYSTVNHRLKLLLDHGLVKKEYSEGGYYAITEKGEAYLAGEIDADDLED
jgi:repressor of nif and glnA expression